MTKNEKYEDYRQIAFPGDIVLFHGHALISRLIQNFDNAYYNHTALVMQTNERIFCIDSNSNGTQPHFLSQEINDYKDFDVLRPLKSDLEIELALHKVLDKAEQGLSYDYFALPRIALNRKLGLNIKYVVNNKDYCSEFARRYTNFLALSCYNNNGDISPEDFYRWLNPFQLEKLTNFERNK